jgi:hypothetical protein
MAVQHRDRPLCVLHVLMLCSPAKRPPDADEAEI